MVASVLVVGGTHGNECNAPWLLQQWGPSFAALQRPRLKVQTALGNPRALQCCRRYIDRDLNRSFRGDLLQAQPSPADQWEVQRARELVQSFGPQGTKPCQVVIDLHSTTAAMGNSLVVYGRRPADLALAAACQERLGLPIYQHEHDPDQTGFMAEAWPCGLVLEVGPVPQGVISPVICQQTQLGLETLLDLLDEASQGPIQLRSPLRVHRHSGSLDLPRDSSGQPTACLHPARLKSDWTPLKPGAPLFQQGDGTVIPFSGEPDQVTVFSNEAAYQEKHIATSLARRVSIPCDPSWSRALSDLLQGVDR